MEVHAQPQPQRRNRRLVKIVLAYAVLAGLVAACWVLPKVLRPKPTADWLMLMAKREPDPAKSFPLVKDAAEQGNADAQAMLATMLHEGIGTPRDRIGSIAWLKAAAAQNQPEAMNTLGALAIQGEVPDVSNAEAIALLKKAADAGMTQAAYNLANCYHTGRVVPEDPKAAFAWMKRAADAGYPEAKLKVAFCYRDGYGVEKNPAEAARLIEEVNNPNPLLGKSVLDNQTTLIRP